MYDRYGLTAPINMDFSKMTRANFAFFQTNTDGDIFGTDSWADPICLWGFNDWMEEDGFSIAHGMNRENEKKKHINIIYTTSISYSNCKCFNTRSTEKNTSVQLGNMKRSQDINIKRCFQCQCLPNPCCKASLVFSFHPPILL